MVFLFIYHTAELFVSSVYCVGYSMYTFLAGGCLFVKPLIGGAATIHRPFHNSSFLDLPDVVDLDKFIGQDTPVAVALGGSSCT